MLIPFGILSAAGIGSDYELIESQILGTAAASVTFTGLSVYSDTYKHLQVRVTSNSSPSRFGLQFNSASSLGNYAFHYLFANGSSVLSGGSSGGTSFTSAITCGIGTTSSSAAVMDILDCYSTTKNKTVRSYSGYPNEIALWSGVWLNTNAISSLTVLGVESPVRNFGIGSRFSLYGIKG